ncbi:ABC-type antimicrobial peptide transport system permease subunit [Runella defluvii]|uniref:ABC-type antimicrobial peptide transport system permease subunit n=1 Tax=Runella defluvii TaxID=370973 RepID=A0A7W5ZRF2_9BACT|nr:permease prefix domain 2-containing transporter [Runella defluvii]MBB3840237.1 ABC-type antimicrobial peptide transport system permease subunit [Runella defluvii]
MHSNPPRLADRFLQFFCAPHLLEEVQGDLHEEFEYQVKHAGARRARWRYWRDVLGFFQPRYIKRKPSQYPQTYLFSLNMLHNYFKIAVRNLLKNKGYSFINIGGLAVGMVVAILSGLWVWDELSFNQYHQNYARIAQVMIKETDEGNVGYSNSVPYPLATELKTNYQSNFKHIVTSSNAGDYILTAGENKFLRKGQFMEAKAPEMLSLKMIYGSWAGLNDPHSILISASTAQALFGNTDPLNQVMKINNKLDVTVTGVYEDLPLNSVFNDINFFAPFDLWVSDNEWVRESANNWHNHFLKVYVEIQPTTDFERVSKTIKDAELKNIGDLKDKVAENPQVFLHPMHNWHLYPFKNGAVNPEPTQMVWLIGIIGAFVLLLACINFVNLSTARSEKRAKEVGIRKAIGSVQGQLISQFFSESFLVVLLSFFLAFVLLLFTLTWFNDLSAKAISIPWTNAYFWLFCLLFIFVTGLLAGSYPSFYLSSFQPIKVLKGINVVNRFAFTPRKVLVVFQFTISVTLIISTIVVYRQVQFAKNRPVGYTREGLLMLAMKSDAFSGKHEILRTELKNTGAVSEISASMGRMTQVSSNNDGLEWKGKKPEQDKNFSTLTVSHEHGKTVGWQFVKGRDFSRKYATDSSGIVINEAAMKYMGLQNPVGETISWKFRENTAYFQVIGIIKDMVMESPYEPVKPAIFYIKPINGKPNWLNVKINPSVSISQALPKIEAVFKKIVPTVPFDYQFVDDEYNAKFKAEERIGKLATFFAVLAIFISCLGLFGLASFVAEQRTKEIGIRKVLGASVAGIWQLLSKDFVVLVILSCLISVPISHYFMDGWLQKYTYRTEISWWIFGVTSLGALGITLLTVSFQAIKAALVNPVKSLKSE